MHYAHHLNSLFQFQLSTMPSGDDSLEDLSDLVGPELAGLVIPSSSSSSSGSSSTAVTSGSVCTVTTAGAKSAGNSNGGGDMSDLSDLKSSDLLPTLPGMLDIDRIFADFQASGGGANGGGQLQGHQVSWVANQKVNCW